MTVSLRCACLTVPSITESTLKWLIEGSEARKFVIKDLHWNGKRARAIVVEMLMPWRFYLQQNHMSKELSVTMTNL